MPVSNLAAASSRRLSRRGGGAIVVGLRWSTLIVAGLMTVTLYLRMFVIPGVWVPDEQVIGGRTVTRRHPEKLYKEHNSAKLPT